MTLDEKATVTQRLAGMTDRKLVELWVANLAVLVLARCASRPLTRTADKLLDMLDGTHRLALEEGHRRGLKLKGQLT